MRLDEMDSDRIWRPAAPLQRRVLAGIFTGSRVLLMIVPLRLVVFGFVRMSHSPGSIRTFAEMGNFMASLRTWAFVYYLAIALMILYAFLVRPVLRGATWGQERFGIVVEDLDGIAPGWGPMGIRFLVHLGWLIIWPLGLLYLVWCFIKDDEPLDFTDRWSGTRQFDEEGETLPLRQAIGQAFFPAALAIILLIVAVGPLSAWMMSGYLNLHLVEKVEPAPTPEELNAAKVQQTLQAQQDAMKQ